MLENSGYKVNSGVPANRQFFKDFKENPPDAALLDLSRSPSQGRDLGIYIRHTKATRGVILVFVGGDAKVLKKLRQLLPDAAFTDWSNVKQDLQKALDNPPAQPIVPSSNFAGYSGAPLMKKLGIRSKMHLGLANAPEHWTDLLVGLPEDVDIFSPPNHHCELILWFVTSQQQLEEEITRMRDLAERARVWILWPKKSSALAGDLTQPTVRAKGLAAGLVDYKVCSVNQTWSGLLFTKKK